MFHKLQFTFVSVYSYDVTYFFFNNKKDRETNLAFIMCMLFNFDYETR